jgi:hypothetical protein
MADGGRARWSANGGGARTVGGEASGDPRLRSPRPLTPTFRCATRMAGFPRRRFPPSRCQPGPGGTPPRRPQDPGPTHRRERTRTAQGYGPGGLLRPDEQGGRVATAPARPRPPDLWPVTGRRRPGRAPPLRHEQVDEVRTDHPDPTGAFGPPGPRPGRRSRRTRPALGEDGPAASRGPASCRGGLPWGKGEGERPGGRSPSDSGLVGLGYSLQWPGPM